MFCNLSLKRLRTITHGKIYHSIKEKFAEVIASKNKGIIMKTVMPELKGKADGKVISEIVNKLCQ